MVALPVRRRSLTIFSARRLMESVIEGLIFLPARPLTDLFRSSRLVRIPGCFGIIVQESDRSDAL
jgi:hypothetical protein